MTGHHARKPRIPFEILIAILVVVAGGVAFATTRGGDEARSAASPSVSRVPRSSAASPSPSAGSDVATPGASPVPDEPRAKLLIHGTGDVSLDPSYIPAFRTNGYRWAWTGLHGLFRRDDLTVVNLECPATAVAAPVPKRFNFRCDPAALPVAERYGVDVANQSNNHAYDQGPGGLVDSLAQIRKAGLQPIGAGANRHDALEPALLDVKGWRIAVLGIDEVLDPIDEVAGAGKPGTAAGHDFSLALRAVRRAAAESDLVVVMIHWGVELDTQPRAYQVQEGHRMIDAGADVVFGGHSHRLQPMETYRGRPIFYSLGNFVWPHLSTEGSTTAVAEVIVQPNGKIKGKLLRVYIVSDGHPVLR